MKDKNVSNDVIEGRATVKEDCVEASAENIASTVMEVGVRSGKEIIGGAIDFLQDGGKAANYAFNNDFDSACDVLKDRFEKIGQGLSETGRAATRLAENAIDDPKNMLTEDGKKNLVKVATTALSAVIGVSVVS